MIKKLIKLLPLVGFICALFFYTLAGADDGTGAMMINPGIGTGGGMATEVSNLNGTSLPESTKEDKCLPLTKYNDYDVSKGKDCTFCALFEVFFDTISKVAQKADDAFSKAMIPVVAIGFAIWLVVYMLGYLASVETRDIKDAFQEMVTRGGLVVLTVVILTYGSCRFYNDFINPVYETFLRGANVALKVELDGGGQLSAEAAQLTTTKSGGLPATMKSNIVETMTAMERVITKLRALGSSLMCYSWKKRILFVIPRLSYLVTGLFYWIMAMVMITIVPFLMIDIVFELGVAVALLPFAIASYPFKQMRQYSKKVWETFLNSGFGFLFMALVIVMILAVFEQSVNVSMAEALGQDALNESWGGLFDSTNNEDKMDTYLKSIAWFRGPFLQLLFCFVLAWAVMNLGKEFADEFASSISSTTIGSSIATMGFSSVKGMSKRILAPIGNQLSDKVNHAAAAAIRAPGKWIGQGVSNARMKRWDRKAKKGGTTDSNGTTTNVKKGIFGTRIYSVRADGTRVRQRKNIFGRVRVTEINNIGGLVSTKKIKYNRKGAVSSISNNVVANDRLSQHLITDDGAIDKDVYNRMSEGLSEEEKKKLDEKVFAYITQKNLNKKTSKGAIVSQRFEQMPDGKMRMIAITSKGETIITELDMKQLSGGSNSMRYLLKQSIMKQNGDVTILSTDGIQNKIEEFKSSGGRSIDEINANQMADKHGSFERKSAVTQSRYYNEETARESLIREDQKLYNGMGQYAGYINERGEFVDKHGKVVARQMRDEDGNEMRRRSLGEHEGYSVKMAPDGHMRQFEYREDGTIKWGKEADDKPVVFEAVDGSGTFSLQNGRLTNKSTGETYGGGRASDSRYDKQFRKADNLFSNTDYN